MAELLLRVKTKSGQQVIRNLTADSTIKDLKTELSNLSNVPANRLHVLTGFPPKAFDISQENTVLATSGLRSGDLIILEEKQPDPENKSEQEKPSENVSRSHVSENVNDVPGILMKHVVPADNSCLFSSIHFVLNGKIDETASVASWMRQIIAEVVAQDRDNFSEAILGKPNDEYCKWILNDSSWGGAIELAVLSNHYGIEIAVVDTINAIINRFGEDQQYAHRVFLLFDGIHYDPLYMESLEVCIHY